MFTQNYVSLSEAISLGKVKLTLIENLALFIKDLKALGFKCTIKNEILYININK